MPLSDAARLGDLLPFRQRKKKAFGALLRRVRGGGVIICMLGRSVLFFALKDNFREFGRVLFFFILYPTFISRI